MLFVCTQYKAQIWIHEDAAKNFLVCQEHHAAARAGLPQGQGGLTHRTASRKGCGANMWPWGAGRDESICSHAPRVSILEQLLKAVAR